MTPHEFTVRRRSLSERLIQALLRLFRGRGTYRQGDVDAFLLQAVPLVEGTQRALAQLTSAYLVQLAAEQTGRRLLPVAVAATDSVRLRRGVTPHEVYRRPFTAIYTALSEGKPFPRAVEIGQNRLRQIVEMDLQQTYAHTSRAVMRRLPEGMRPEFWRRVLVGSQNCAMCIVASTQRYHREELNPIHPGCDCRVDPLFGEDPGQVIEPELLEQVHAAVNSLTGKSDRGARAPDYRKITVEMTREHGELGPLLARPLDRFTGPADL